MLKEISRHLADNSGDENISKLIWMVIAFICGGIIFVLIVGVKSPIRSWFNKVIDSWFGDGHGEFDTDPA